MKINNAQNFSILYVEDDLALQKETAIFLWKIFAQVDVASNGQEALDLYLLHGYDIVLTDISMPYMDGLELIQHIQANNPQQEIIVISAHTDADYLVKAIELGVSGYLIKPLNIKQILKVIDKSIEKLTLFDENERYKNTLEIMVDNRTKKILQLQDQLVSNYEKAIHSLVKMIEDRDTYTGGHSERVATYSKEIAKEMGLVEEEQELVYQAAILHDIGKVITPDAILLKPGKLDKSEYDLIKDHVNVGYEILSDVPMYHEIAKIIRAHHERHDGSGYPQGLQGKEIPLYARIMSIADTFDAMTTSRVYKTKKSVSEAVKELQILSGTWFDPKVLDIALQTLEKVEVETVPTQDPQTRIDDERFAYFYKDLLTGAYNHYYLDYILEKRKESDESISLDMLYLQNFSHYNKKFGWSAGDTILKEFVAYLQSTYQDAKIFRIFGDDFAIIRSAMKHIDVEALNALPIFKDAGITCQHGVFNSLEKTIESYKELEMM